MVSVRASRLPWLVAAAGYAALALAYTWPLARHLSSVFPHDAYDPALNTWILWWNAHVLPLTARWWNAPFFWPAQGSLALSEHLIGLSLLATPLQWTGLTPLAAYNVAVIASFALAALAAHALGFVLTRRHDAALVAGLAYGFTLYRLDQLPHIQVLWSFGMPLALAAAHMYLENGRRVWLVIFGGAWLVQALSNGYFLLFFPILLALWLWWHGAGDWRRPLRVAAVWFAASLPLVPILAVYHRVQTELNLGRSINEIEMFSADLTSIFAAPIDSTVWHALSKFERHEGALFPGAVVFALVAIGIIAAVRRPFEAVGESLAVRTIRRALAIAGIVVAVLAASVGLFGPWRIGSGVRPLISLGRADKPLTVALYLLATALLVSPHVRALRRRKSAFAFYLLAAAAMYVLALGPRPRLNGIPVLFRAPYSALLALPGYGGLRVPARLGMLVILCLTTAAAIAFSRLTERMDGPRRRLLAAAAAVLIVVECWPTFRTMSAPQGVRLLQHLPPDAVVVEFPLGATDRDVAAMDRSIEHRHPTINGYSGYEPPHYLVLKIALAHDDPEVLDAVTDGRPLYAAVAHGKEFEHWASLLSRHPRQHTIADDGEWRLYRIDPPPADPAEKSGRLAIANVAANLRTDDVARLADGNVKTVWNAGQLQRGNEAVVVDLGQEHTVSAVHMELGPYVYDFPRALNVDCAGDDENWTPCWRGSIAGLLIRGILQDPSRAPMDIPIDKPGIRRIRLQQTRVDDKNGWSIAELSVFGR